MPGLDGSGFYFQPLIDVLGSQYPCRIIPYPAGVFHYTELRDYVLTQLPRHKNVVIVAESFGGPLGIMVAESLGSQLKGLVLCATFCKCPVPQWLIRLAQKLYTRLQKHRKPSMFMLNQLLYNGRNSSAAEKIFNELVVVNATTIIARLQQVQTINVKANLMMLKTPVLIINAKSDRLVWHSGFTNSFQTMRVKGPHELAGQNSAVVAATIQKFVSELG